MATYVKLQSGSWRVQVRRKRQYASNTFLRRSDAEGIRVAGEGDTLRAVALRCESRGRCGVAAWGLATDHGYREIVPVMGANDG